MHHVVDLKVGVQAIGAGRAGELNVNLLVKFPLHVHDTVVPYFGVGPSLVAVSRSVECGITCFPAIHREVSFGGVLELGGYYWFREAGGLLFEINYNVAGWTHSTEHQIGGSIGFVYRF